MAEAIARYPQLARTGPASVEGSVLVHASYQGEILQEAFQVRITCPSQISDRVPVLYETGDRTVAIAQKWKLEDTRDLHCNPGSGSACVCVKQEEIIKFPPGSDLSFFIGGLARDYLYGLAFFDRHGRWPWEERSHGAVGLLEFYADRSGPLQPHDMEAIIPHFLADPNWLEFDKQIRQPRGHRACVCGSGRQFRKCHPIAFQGVIKFAAEADRVGLKRRCLFDKARAKAGQSK